MKAGVVLSLWIAVALVVLSATGCGYSLAGRGSFLPAHVQTIGVPTFLNSTPVFDIEQMLTQRVRQEFIGRGKYKVVPQSAGADAVLIGNVLAVNVAPTAFTDQQQASRYVVVVVMWVEFRDVKENKVLYDNPGLVFRDEYDVTNASAALDPNAFFGGGSNALERIAEDFSRSLVTSILEAF